MLKRGLRAEFPSGQFIVCSDQKSSHRDGNCLAANLLTVLAAVADDLFLAVPLLLIGASVRFGSVAVVALFAGDQ
jgi:hypothetical protein